MIGTWFHLELQRNIPTLDALIDQRLWSRFISFKSARVVGTWQPLPWDQTYPLRKMGIDLHTFPQNFKMNQANSLDTSYLTVSSHDKEFP